MPEKIISALENHSKTIPDKIALTVKRAERYVEYSYKSLFETVCSVSTHLASIGIKKGANVALFSENSPEWLIAYLSIHASGAAVVPLDAQYSLRELENLLPFASVEFMLCSTTLYEKTIKTASERLKLKRVLIIDPECDDSIFKLPPSSSYPALRSDGDCMSLIFTSGTTGDPKGVVLSDKNLHSNAESIIKWNVVTPHDVILLILPLHHCFCFTATALLPLLRGASITFQPSLKGPDILAAMNETRVTKMAGVPQLFSIFEKNIFSKIEKLPLINRKIFNALFFVSEKIYDKTGIMIGKLLFKKITSAFGLDFKFFVSGGAKLDAQTAKNLTILGLEIIEGYGLTETAPVLTLNPPGAAKIGSCGKALPDVEIAVSNPDKDGVGEIIARGPNIMSGYYLKDDATKEIIKDGWFYTGDLGYIDSEGYLFITGRAKDVIVMASGKNVYPEEVEKHYQQCPYISELCVVGEESADGRVEKLKAIVVPNYRLLREQNIANCTHHIKCDFEELSLKVPSYMRINDFKIISEELPRTRLGKLKRNEIKKRGLFEQEADDEVKKPELTPDEKALMATPIIEKFIERLMRLCAKKEIYPKDSLELDLGIDSLTRLELLVILDTEFGLKIKENEAASLIRVEDILNKLSTEGNINASASFQTGLLAAIKKEPETPFEDAYYLKPGFFGWLFKGVLKKAVIMFFKLSCGIKVNGLEKLKLKRGFLLCPNHTSYIDAVIIFAAIKNFHSRRMFFFALEEMFGGRMFSWFRKLFHIITSGTESTMVRSLQYSSRALGAGFPICIFPEGQRTIDENPSAPKKGFAILACEHKVPVYPVYIKGAINMFSKPNPGFNPSFLTISIGDPIFPADKNAYEDGDYEEIMKKWSQTIKTLKENEGNA